MNEKIAEICNILKGIKKLDAKTYSNLLSIYGEKAVNDTIEYLMDEDDKNISKIVNYDDNFLKSIYELYEMDISNTSTLTNEENIEIANEIHSIVLEMNALIDDYCKKNNIVGLCDQNWLSDKVKNCISICDDKDTLFRLKRLYNSFLSKRNKIVEGNLRLVISYAKRFNFNNGTLFVDFIQCGNIGLMKAVEKFDPSYNVPFSTYAYYWIKYYIFKDLSNHICNFYTPANLVSTYFRLKKMRNVLIMKLGRESTNIELSNATGVSLDNIQLLYSTFNDVISLSSPISTEMNNDNSIEDFISDDNASVLSKVCEAELSKLIDEQLVFLTEKERYIIEKRFGFGNSERMTLEAIGEEIGLTRERVRQIEKNAIKKLSPRCKNLKDYLK